MPHYVTHEMTRTIRGMKAVFKLKAPFGADVSEITKKIDGIYDWAESDPDQFGLFDEPAADPGDPEED